MSQNGKKAPFFIVGCQRSGTTLLQTLLDANPNIAIPPESHFFKRFSPFFSLYGDLSQEKNLRKFVHDVLTDVRIRTWQLDVTADDFCRQLSSRSLKGAVTLLFELYAKKEKKPRWGEKTPSHLFYLKEIKTFFPDAKIIHVVRDGRDVAESLSRVLIGPKSIYRIAKRWRNFILAFQEAKKLLDPEDYIEVFYQDLVSDPVRQTARILGFIGEEQAHDYRAYSETRRTKNYIKAHPLHRSLSEPVTRDKIGKYKDAFNHRDIEIFESIAGDCLRLYGFPPETSGHTTISSAEKAYFLFQDYIWRYARKLGSPSVVRLDVEQVVQISARKMMGKIRKIQRSLSLKGD